MTICRICKLSFMLEDIPNLPICWRCKYLTPNCYDMFSFGLAVGLQKKFIKIHEFPYDVDWNRAKSIIRSKHIYNLDIPSMAIVKNTQRRKNVYYNLLSDKLDLPNELIVMIVKFC